MIISVCIGRDSVGSFTAGVAYIYVDATSLKAYTFITLCTCSIYQRMTCPARYNE